MKNRIIYVIIATFLVTTSCNKWLDIKPKTQIDREDMFSTELGFKDALVGCYMGLKDKDLYGEKLTMSTIEHLVSHWNTNANSGEKAWSTFDFKHKTVEEDIVKIHNKLYNVICRANDLLSYIDKNKDVFASEEMRTMIKAEALAIRAFCHLDVLRLFGPIPRKLDLPTNNKLAYVKTVSREKLERCSYKEFIVQLEEDLNNSAAMLKEVDPVMENTYDYLNTVGYKPNDEFYRYRRLRFNYYAIEALKARFYLYTQQNKKAYDAAMFVIDSKKAALSSSTDIAKGFYTLPKEHLLSLNVYNIIDYAHPLFMEGKLTKTQSSVDKDIYANSTFDIRKSGLWESLTLTGGTKIYALKKYYQTAPVYSWYAVTDIQIIPILRLSEMYLIAMEAGTIEQSNILAENYYAMRNLSAVVFTDEGKRETEIVKEYQRDFYAEGQMFFVYKRLASEKILWFTGTMKPENYIVPMPLTDITYE